MLTRVLALGVGATDQILILEWRGIISNDAVHVKATCVGDCQNEPR
jgi:hypothetical protein